VGHTASLFGPSPTYFFSYWTEIQGAGQSDSLFSSARSGLNQVNVLVLHQYFQQGSVTRPRNSLCHHASQGFDSTFVATDAMVQKVRAEPIDRTRHHIGEYPLLKDSVDYSFPIIVAYGDKDIYGESKNRVRIRFPSARIVEIENAGHIAWRHNGDRFFALLRDFYKIGDEGDR